MVRVQGRDDRGARQGWLWCKVGIVRVQGKGGLGTTRDGRGARQGWLGCKVRWLKCKAGIVRVQGRGGQVARQG